MNTAVFVLHRTKNGPRLAASSIIHAVTQNSSPPFLSGKRNVSQRFRHSGRSSLNSQIDTELSAALLGFNGEAVLYCQGISDAAAYEYAMNYARMLQNRAKGVEVSLPRIPAGLFEPNRNLIRSTLDRMCQKYFPSK